MKKQALYRELAIYYDLIYGWKNYREEVDKINKLISRFKKSNGKDLLEVACGTGQHTQYFKQRFHCMGADINQEMLAIAKKKIKNVTFKKADMITLNLNKKFDVIVCLFSSIGYVKTYPNLAKTFKNFAKHLKTGGVVIVEPWFTRSTYKNGSVHMTLYESKDFKLTRATVSKMKNNVSEMDMHYLIAEQNKGIKYFVDKHELGLFDINKTLQLMKQADLKTTFFKKGLMKDRGLFIGVKN